MPKRSSEKQAELDKYLSLNLAAIDSISERELGNMVYDGIDPLAEIFELQRNQIKKMHKEGRLDRLQGKFHIYSGRAQRAAFESAPATSNNNERVMTQEYEQNGMIIQDVTLITGGRKGDDFSGPIKSPDNLKSIWIYRTRSKQYSSTSINISFRYAAGGIYQANVYDENITVSWNGNNNLIIRTSSKFEAPVKVKELVSRGEKITISYEEI